jgi:tight adherence protein C
MLGLASDRKDLRRRASEGVQPAAPAGGPGRPATAQPFERLVAFLDQNLSGDTKQNRLLRLQLIQAGFFDQRAGAVYFGARLAGALALGIGGLVVLPLLFGESTGSAKWLWCCALVIVGYFVPTLALKRRIAKRVAQHRTGFPDFMDLMVVCAEAGLSMESGIERIARELVDGYPSLAENLYMASLEIRAGKTFTEAFERLGERLGIEEAMMLATLLQQSAELGTSLSGSLRVYSDEMRNKRLSRAEEKAYSLPAKLTVPLILFVFPVLLFVLMLPVVIRISGAGLGG